MAGHVDQAFRDFREFLSGTRAPALVGQSLATVVLQDQSTVAAAVASWAYATPAPDRFSVLMAARAKVFDIFFYRVVRFRRIYDFFDRFEQALLEAVPETDRTRLAELLAESPWREIRPHGSFRDPLEFALEKRRRASVQRERFNEEVYRNATHQLLSVEKRHTFDDDRTADLVALYQSQLAGVFDDFVDLIKDPQQRREILLANTADKHAVYSTKSRFDVANYISHLLEFVIALVNDDFFEHGIQVFNVVRQIQRDFNLDSSGTHWQRFKTQCDLVNRQKLAAYGSDPTRAVLLRSFLPSFEPWGMEQLMETILLEPDRRTRKLAVSLLGAYGSEAYELVVMRLASPPPSSEWYYIRNLAYLLSRIVTGNDALKHRAVVALAPHLDLACPRQLSLQVVAALGFIGTAEAANILVTKLDEFAKQFADPEIAEICHKMVSTLLALGTERSVEAAFEFCLSHNLVVQYREEIARAPLPPSVRARVAGRVRQESRKLRITRSLIGNTSVARSLLSAVGHSGYPEIDEVCREIAAGFSAQNQLAVAASKLLATPPPRPLLTADRILHSYLAKMDLSQALCHALDAGTSGRIDVRTREGANCWIDVWQGRAVAAEVSETLIENERAVFWIALLEPRDIASVRFVPAERPPEAEAIKTPARELLRDLVFQRAEVRQIVDGLISPESRFRRRDVHPIYTNFKRLPGREKYAAVWGAIAEETDMKAIRTKTGLSRHDIFRVLLYFHRRNMLSVDGGHRDSGAARVADAIATIEVYIRRIEERPLQLRFYHTAAEGCAFLERHSTDEAMSDAAAKVSAYLLDAYKAHRAFVAENVDVCRRTLDLVGRFHRTGNPADRQALVDYLAFTFSAVSAAPAAEPPVSRSLLEQLENIEFCNDAFDPPGRECDKATIDTLVETIEHALSASGVSVEALAAGEQPTPAEAKIVLELFGDVANAYSKPIKDFVREIARAGAAGTPVSSGWLRVVEPTVMLLHKVASAMHFREAEEIFGELARAIGDEAEREVSPDFADLFLAEHMRLAELSPVAFALHLSNDQLALKRSALLATFVLRQMEGVTDDVLVRLAAANLTTFEAFLDAVPEDIVVSAGIDATLAEKIFMKFYQYQDLYRHPGDPAAHPKYAAMFGIGLTTVKEICVELERISYGEQAGKETDASRKAGLVASRQRALASLLALLCVRGEYDRVEEVQLAPFDKRVLMLDEYFAALEAAAPPPPTAADGNALADAAM